MPKSPTLYCDDGSEIELPFKWEICQACNGHGKSSSYLGAFTHDEMRDEGYEFMEDYMAGHYDRACDTCGGSGKIKIADRARMSKSHWREWKAQLQADAECEAESRHERMMLGEY